MSNKFCVYCGQQVEGNDQFCHKCGATVDNQKGSPPAQNQNDNLHSNSLATPVIKEKKHHSAKKFKPLMLIPIILFSIALPFIIMSSIGSVKVPIGTLDYEVNSMEYLDVELIIDNSIGLIDITYDDSMDALFEATIDVLGGVKSSIEDAKNFEHTMQNNITIITFDSEDDFVRHMSFKSLVHNVYISLNPDAIVNFALSSSIGNIRMDLDDVDNLVMNDVQLSSSTGSVKFYSDDAINTTIEDIDLSTDTGRIVFDFDDAIGTSVNQINFYASTGGIDASLGETMNIDSSDIVMSTSTGSIELTFENIIFNEDTNWDVETSTGSISIEFIQNIILPINFTTAFNVETSTGCITVDGEVAIDLGIAITADTNTGSIDLPSGFSYYTSTDYYLKNNQFSFTLLTSTGSITAEIEN